MSWIESVNKDFKITMKSKQGFKDSVTFTPNWLAAGRLTDFNIAVFNFRNVAGSLVKRNQIIGAVYDIEIFFQGVDNLEVSAAFKEASKNPHSWTVSHPLYGQILVQPLSLRYDNSAMNVTRITGQWMETVGATAINNSIDPVDIIAQKKLDTDITFSQSYAVTVPEPAIGDITAMQDNITLAERLQEGFATTNDNIQLAINTYNAVNSKIDDAIADVYSAINGVQTMLSLPAYFSNKVINRVDFLIDMANQIYADISTIELPHLKKLYENNVAAIISSVCATTVYQVAPGDYPNRNDVVQVINSLVGVYNDYITNLDFLQTDNGADPGSYIPDFSSIDQLTSLVYYTIANLFGIAASAKQQRIFELPTDSNIILIAFELYGLLPDDSMITQLMNDNAFTGDEHFWIRKGRDIIYYV